MSVTACTWMRALEEAFLKVESRVPFWQARLWHAQ